MFKVPFILFVLILFIASHRMDSATLRLTDYEDSEWDELFGHLSLTSRESNKVEDDDEKESEKIPPVVVSDMIEKPTVPPIPPAAPFVFNPDSKDKLPSIGANTHGNMEGIAISQNRGISVGIYIVSSSYNNFNTIFGNSNSTKRVKGS